MDALSFGQKILGRLFTRELFAFRPEIYGADGLQTDPLREKQTRLGKICGTRLFSRVYPGVPGRVHIHDAMLANDGPGEIAHYDAVGLSAAENVVKALQTAGRDIADVEDALDMACGYGRVLRQLQQCMPRACWTACDRVEEAVRFCREEFGAEALVSSEDLSQFQLSRAYDLIWVGSLFTHLPSELCQALAISLFAALKPGGLLVFSFQGPSCLAHLDAYGPRFGEQAARFRSELDASGAAYRSYFDTEPGYGIALHTKTFFENALGEKFNTTARCVYYAERGWDGHQDVIAFARAASVP